MFVSSPLLFLRQGGCDRTARGWYRVAGRPQKIKCAKTIGFPMVFIHFWLGSRLQTRPNAVTEAADFKVGSRFGEPF